MRGKFIYFVVFKLRLLLPIDSKRLHLSLLSLGGRLGVFGFVLTQLVINFAVFGVEVMYLSILSFANTVSAVFACLNSPTLLLSTHTMYTNKFCFCNSIFTLHYSIPSHSFHFSFACLLVYSPRTNLTRVSDIITVKYKITAKNNTKQNACINTPNTRCI